MPIPGTRRLDRVEENLGAAALGMSTAELADIEAAMATIEIHGERLPASVLKYSYI